MIRLLTHLGGATATLGAGLVLVILGGEERRVGLAALLANAFSHAAVQVLKRVVARPRPCDPWGRPLALVALPDPYSFPSGHAAASMAVAASVVLAWHRAFAFGLLALAVVIGYSRVRLRVHHLVDVVVGALLGVAGAVVAHEVVY